VVRPYMLPGPVRRSQYGRACDLLNKAIKKAYTKAWDITTKEEEEEERGAKAITEKHRFDWVLRTFGKSLKKLPLSCLQDRFMDSFLPEFPPADDNPAVGGFAIAQELRNRPERLQVIFGVWVEMLCFVANHCSRESHARQLSSGGELVTIAWLMAKHANLPVVAAATEHRRHTDVSKRSAPPVVLEQTVPRCKYIRPWYPDHPGSNYEANEKADRDNYRKAAGKPRFLRTTKRRRTDR